MAWKYRVLILLALFAALALGLWYSAGRRPPATGVETVSRPPRIRPDYAGVVLPPNIAPLNFAVRETGARYFVRIRSTAGDAVELPSRSPEIRIPLPAWRRLLEANRGRELFFDVYVLADGRWQRYEPVVNRIAAEDIDSTLVYRLVGPIHNRWRETAIYQRDVTAFTATPLLLGKSLGNGCVNCHSFPSGDPGRMLVGIRGKTFGNATLLAEGDAATKIDKPFGYTAWHPSGRMAAHSVNKVRQFFHAAGDEVRDVVDVDGGLAYYRVDTRESKRIARASDDERLETYPAWSPDGRWLYYCGAPLLWDDRNSWPPERYAEVRYDLMRIAYDLEADRWGEPETVLSAEEAGLSVLMPRVSPDGKYLLFCMCRYGCFPVFQPSSDLYLMDLADRSYRKLDVNSEFSESYHSWSSNSRWIAFSSRRQGGFFTRCYLSYVDGSGRAQKPFVLPQEDPTAYDSLIKSICVPELVTAAVPTPPAVLARAARSPDAVEPRSPDGEQPKLELVEPWQQAGR